jgi:hypothetical protein
MAKAKKEQQNSKPRRRFSLLKAFFILAGADLILLLAPEYGLLNSLFYLGDMITWASLFAGIGLLVTGFRGLYGQE